MVIKKPEVCEIKKKNKPKTNQKPHTQDPPLLYSQVHFKGSPIALCAFLRGKAGRKEIIHAFNVLLPVKEALQLLEELVLRFFIYIYIYL